MCIFHQWSKWEQYTINYKFISKDYIGKEFIKTEERQKRFCIKCNKIQDELIHEY